VRNHTLGAIAIPEDVWWQDEFAWTPVEQATDRGLTGALIIDQGVKLGGRPITLISNAGGGWVPRSTVLALQAQRAVPATTYTLTLADGRSFTVAHDQEREFAADPIRPALDMHANSKYRITLPLIEI
jgi:hypothetical protein